MSEVDTSAEVWLILKRGYYYRPDNCGYTAIKSEAGRYSLDKTAVHFPNESDSGLSFIHEDKADDYSPACDVITKLQHQNKILRQERDDLALVIMGGEDAPGLAASLSVDELQKLQLDNQASAKAFHEYDLTQARNDALEEAAKVAMTVYDDGMYFGEASVDTSDSIYQQGAFEVYEEIRSLITPPKGE